MSPDRGMRHYVHLPAGLVLAVMSLLLNTAWALLNKPLAAVDEPAHLQAIMQVRAQHRLPEVHFSFQNTPAGEVVHTPIDQATFDFAVGLGYDKIPLLLLPYEGMQPPLYYLIAGLAAHSVPPDSVPVLYVGRLVAGLFGAGTVYFCWAALRQVAPQAPMLAAAGASVVLLLPQFAFNSAAASNDSAVNCLSAACFYVWFRGLREPGYDLWLRRAGLVLGLAVLAKLSAVALLPGLILVWLFRTRGRGPTAEDGYLRYSLRLGANAGGVLLATCGWWLVRNALVYGDFTGSYDVIRFYQGYLEPVDFRDAGAFALFAQLTTESFWGLFGLMSIRLPRVAYQLSNLLGLGLLTLSLIGLIRGGSRRLRGSSTIPAYAWQAGVVMAAATATLLVGYLQYNLTVAFQPQSRYLFPVLVPLGLVMTGGLYALAPGRPAKVVALSIPLLWLAILHAVGLATVLHLR